MARLGRSQPIPAFISKVYLPPAAPPPTVNAGWLVNVNQVCGMLIKNTASQVVNFELVNATTGAPLTGASVTVKVSLDGTQGSGGGAVTELGTGQYKYVPTQAETNGKSIGFSFSASNAVPQGIQIFTVGQDPSLTTFDVNILKLLGTAWLAPGTPGTPDVNTKLLGGTSQTGKDLGTLLTTAMTESYNVDGSAPTPAQALMGILQCLTQFSIVTTTMTVKKLDGSATAMVLTLNDATNPTSVDRTA